MKKRLLFKTVVYSITLVGLFTRCQKPTTPNTPPATIPVLLTVTPSSITQTSAQSGGIITSDGGKSIISYGVCWSTTQNPTTANSKTTNGTGTGSFASSLTGLTVNTIYYVRAYAINSVGTAYGNEVTFSTTNTISTTITDCDGNIYTTVTIGTQVWMLQNLKTTRYRNCDPIPNVTLGSTWVSLTSGAYCNYNNDANNSTTYGRLYNWYAVNNSRNIAPLGWHVPTDAEWTTLVNYLSGASVAGGKLKETGITHWSSPNAYATNQTGFTALPGGYRNTNDGTFYDIKLFGFWWSSTEDMPGFAFQGTAFFREMDSGGSNGGSQVSRSSLYKDIGYSIRCIKD